MPLIQTNTTLWTFSDVVEHLLDLHELDTRDGFNKRRARAAALLAYRDLPSRHAWRYYYRQRLIHTVADQTSSTIAYDHSGGANERMLTLASGTWPSWAAFGRIIIDDVHYEVESRVSDTVITLTETSNPGADVAAGATYALYRSAYPLPADFKSIYALWDVEEERAIPLVDPTRHHAGLQSSYETPETPWEAMIRATGEHYGAMHLHFGPPPDEARAYDLLYRAAPRPLAIDEYSVGTVSITSGDATVTGSGTVFPSNCVGSVIRFSSTSALPTGIHGGLSGDNPFVLQAVIKERTSDTAVELEEDPGQSLTAVGYTISDPVDIEAGAMLTALLRMAEAEWTLKAGRKDATLRQALARQAILEAIEADTRYEKSSPVPSHDRFKRTSVTTDA